VGSRKPISPIRLIMKSPDPRSRLRTVRLGCSCPDRCPIAAGFRDQGRDQLWSGRVHGSAPTLPFGIAGDLYVAISTAAASSTLDAILALAVLSLLTCLWYIVPMVLRAREGG
jgi:hypothetical protein